MNLYFLGSLLDVKNILTQQVGRKTKDIDIKKVFTVGLILGLLGAIGTFPPFFEAFE